MMKARLTLYGLGGFVIVAGVWAPFAAGQDEKAKNTQELVNAKVESAALTEYHRWFRDLRGKWNYKVQWWLTPDSQPEEFRGRSEFNWILGSRFMVEEYSDQREGVRLEGRAMFGYDKGLQKFTMMRVDTLHTAMLTATGAPGQDDKVITLFGDYVDPNSHETVKVKYILKIDRKEPLFQMYVTPPDGEEYKSVDIRYYKKRRAAG